MLSLAVLYKITKFVENNDVDFESCKRYLIDRESIHLCNECYARISDENSIAKQCCIEDHKYLIRFYNLVEDVLKNVDLYIKRIYKQD